MCAMFLFAAGVQAWGGYKDDIGYTRLVLELGTAMPTGSNVPVTQVESPVGSDYMPATNDIAFAGKVFSNATASSPGFTGHATTVGYYLYGANDSVAPGIPRIVNYMADTWGVGDYLHDGMTNAPDVETNRVQNHSWVNYWTGATEAVRRLDYAIDRDRFTAVVAVHNFSSEPVPEMMAACYNTITVGKTDGNHSRGTTTIDGAGRARPEIVVPLGATSIATPVISAAAALLIDKALSNGDPDAARPQVIKALLLAGATKDQFTNWDRTATRPLDDIFGAGQINIFNSYKVLDAGRQTASPTSLVQRAGWDFHSLAAGTNALWFFNVPSNMVMTRLSAVLAWHRRVTDGPGDGFDPQSALPSLDLFFKSATNFGAASEIDVSTSRIDNVEHVYQRHLPPGRYVLEVRADDDADFALAWWSQVAMAPQTTNAVYDAGTFRLTASVSSNVPHLVEAATNLPAMGGWTRLGTNTPVASTLLFEDTNAVSFERRFYRLTPDP